ncbi:MAG TPA: polysaccharide deacetylase family protein [Chloroflexia bacterium]|nr:polysaccharide deacetylase family protein [Chloroflexia bacterium]
MSRFDWRNTLKRGRLDARRYLAEPEAARSMQLSRYSEGTLRLRMLRAVLLASRMPPRLLVLLSRPLRFILPESTWTEMVTDHAYWFGVRLGLERTGKWDQVRGSGVPILLYHRIVPRLDPADPKYSLSLGRFRPQMRLLRLLGYRTISLRELVECHRSGKFPPARSVVVTFDDGYRDNDAAARYMLTNGQSGIIFLVTGRMGHDRDWSLDGHRRMPLLTWDEVRALKKAGFEFGSHTRTHPNLSALGADEACEEIDTARASIISELEDDGHLFAYPYGGSSPEARTCVANAGYPAACGVRRGLSNMHDDLYYLKRITIYGNEKLLNFALRVVLGDNPLDYLPWGRAREWMQRIES